MLQLTDDCDPLELPAVAVHYYSDAARPGHRSSRGPQRVEQSYAARVRATERASGGRTREPKTRLCTTAYGRHLELFEITGPALERYADAHGYELVVLHERLAGGRPPAWDKVVLLHSLVARVRSRRVGRLRRVRARRRARHRRRARARSVPASRRAPDRRAVGSRTPVCIALRGGERSAAVPRSGVVAGPVRARSLVGERGRESRARLPRRPRRPARRAVTLARRSRLPRSGVEQHPRRSVARAVHRALSRASRWPIACASSAGTRRRSDRWRRAGSARRQGRDRHRRRWRHRARHRRAVRRPKARRWCSPRSTRTGPARRRSRSGSASSASCATSATPARRTRSSPRHATTSVGSTCSSTTSGTSVAAAPRSTSRPTPSGTTSTASTSRTCSRARARCCPCSSSRATAAASSTSRRSRRSARSRRAPSTPRSRPRSRASPVRSRSSTRAHGVRVNAIAPDVTETLQVPYSKWVGPDDEHLIPTWVPLGRFGQPADIAGVALFLASDAVGVRHRHDRARRRRYVRGGRVVSDGGGRVDQPAAPTLTAAATRARATGARGPRRRRESWPRRLWRTFVTDVRADADAHAATTPATDRKMVMVFVTAAVALTCGNFLSDGTQPDGSSRSCARSGSAGSRRGCTTAMLVSPHRDFNQLAFWAVVVIIVLRRSRRCSSSGSCSASTCATTDCASRGIASARARRTRCCYAIAAPLIIAASFTASFQERYPFFHPAAGHSLWPYMYVWWVLYFAAVLRAGVLLPRLPACTGSRRGSAGPRSSRWRCRTTCSTTASRCRRRSPRSSAASRSARLSLKTRSIWWGAALHISIALTMDICALTHAGRVFG